LCTCRVAVDYEIFCWIVSLCILNEGFSLLSQKELGVLFTPPIGGENVESWKGLESELKLELKFEDVERYDPVLVL